MFLQKSTSTLSNEVPAVEQEVYLFETTVPSLRASCISPKIRKRTAAQISASGQRFFGGFLLNRRASPGVFDGNDTFVSSVGSESLSRLDAVGVGFLYLSGIDIVSSRSRLSAIFSKTVSIFVMTSALAGRWADAIVAISFQVTAALRESCSLSFLGEIYR